MTLVLATAQYAPLQRKLTGYSATATVAFTASVDLRITKTNAVTTLVAGGTTAYTVTVSNIGPYTATAASLRDPVAAGLSCTAVTCSVAVNATCPVAASVTIAALQSAGGIAVTLPPASTLQFIVTCGVTATGAWLDPKLLQPKLLEPPVSGDALVVSAPNSQPRRANQLNFALQRSHNAIRSDEHNNAHNDIHNNLVSRSASHL